MSINKKEKQLYENHLSDDQALWFAVYTKFKREKVVDALLKEKGITAYLPLQKLTRRWERKIRVVELPLFSCYIFVKIAKKDYVKVLETTGVVGFVRFSKNLISIPEEEIQMVKQILGEGIEIIAEPSRWNKGDEVEIVSGNLAGLKGKLVAQQGKQNFLIELEKLGYTLQLAIDRQLLRKIGAVAS